MTTINYIMSKRFVVHRDYSNGLLTQWEDVFPAGLEEYGVSEDQFHNTIQTLNQMFSQTEYYGCTTCLESLVGCMTFYSYYLCFSGQYERGKKMIEIYLEEQNSTVYSEVIWLNPFRNGLLNVCDFNLDLVLGKEFVD